MKLYPLIALLLVGCAGEVVKDESEAWRSIPLPLACRVDSMAACFIAPGAPDDDEDCLVCPQSDGTLWFFQDPGWGSEHFQADFSTRICRIYGNGAWAIPVEPPDSR